MIAREAAGSRRTQYNGLTSTAIVFVTTTQAAHASIIMTAPAPAPDPAAAAALPTIALALRQGDAAACDAAAVQLRDLVAKAPGDTQAAVCVAIAKNGEVVDAAFVQALGRQGLSDAAQHSLVLAMMTMLLHDDAKEGSTAMMQACPHYLPTLLRIIAQEQPVATCR